MASKPRINLVLVANVQRAKMLRSFGSGGSPKVCPSGCNADLPDEPYITEHAKRGGLANAKRGQCFDNHHKCGQWGVHLRFVAGISGQSKYGAQSVVLSGGYMEDEDHEEWFIYAGSGGRDLSGNKRTNKDQAFDQEFKRYMGPCVSAVRKAIQFTWLRDNWN